MGTPDQVKSKVSISGQIFIFGGGGALKTNIHEILE